MIGFYDLLPLFLRLKDKEASGQGGQESVFQRLMGVFDDERDVMIALIDGMRDLLDPSHTTELCLTFLANFLGVTEFPFSEVTEDRREYVRNLIDAHGIKGTLLSIYREMQARDVASGVFVHELWKTTLYAVDEYVATEADIAYPDSAYKSARVVFINGEPVDEPLPSDGDTPGEYVDQQVDYATARDYRERLNNVFPIHVLVPPPVIRTSLEDEPDELSDSLGGAIYAIFRDDYRVERDDLEVTTACIAGCQLSCQDRCETLCELTCETSCETNCQAACEEDCQAICESFCQSSCELGCQDACQSFCQSECQTTCQSACESACQQACQFACQGAVESCQSYCEFNCQTAQQVACSTGCQISCQSAAQDPCGGAGPAGGGGIT